jgi:hypothetical protein
VGRAGAIPDPGAGRPGRMTAQGSLPEE